MSTRDRIKEQRANQLNVNKSKKQREVELENSTQIKGLFFRTWMNYFLSFFLKDRGTIPGNIGNNLFVITNMYITRKSLSSIYIVQEPGGYMPMMMLYHLVHELRDAGNSAKLSLSVLNSKYAFDPKDESLDDRMEYWAKIIDGRIETSRANRERAARTMYTAELCKSGVRVWKSSIMFTLHAKTGTELKEACQILEKAMIRMGVIYDNCSYKIADTLKKYSMLSTCTPKGGTVLTTNAIISQFAANTGSINDTKGCHLGIDKLNNTPFNIDFSNVSVARNMYICAPSGVGKTVLAVNMAQSAYEQGSSVVFVDIKGNEYTAFINAVGGHIVSLRAESTEYINSWVMHKEDVEGLSAAAVESYFKSRISFSKQQMLILSGLTNRDEVLEFESLLDEFHSAMYLYYGVSSENVNSWEATKKLDPFTVFETFEKYVTAQKIAQYHVKSVTMTTLRMYMTRGGSKSYIFGKDFNYGELLNTRALSFDFGILVKSSNADVDIDVVRLKFLYMSKLNGEFTSSNYSKRIRTFKILEESQIVSDDITKVYVEEFTLRRSQMQDTVLLGNSIKALENSALAIPLIENTRGLFVGELAKDAANYIIDQFDLQEFESLIKMPGSKPEYSHSFAFINKLQDSKTHALIHVEIPKDEYGITQKYKIYCPTNETVR